LLNYATPQNSRRTIAGRDSEGDTIKRAVGLAECEAEIVAVGAGKILGKIERAPDIGDILDGERAAACGFRH
jgi:hypothetical protein